MRATRDYHERHQGPAETHRAEIRGARSEAEGESLRRHRTRHGEGPWRRAGPASAGRAMHTNLVSREFGSWLVSGARIFTTGRSSSRMALEADHCGSCRGPASTSVRPMPFSRPPTSSTRGAAFPTSHHRGYKGPIPHGIPARQSGTASMGATIAWRSCRLEHSSAARARNGGAGS